MECRAPTKRARMEGEEELDIIKLAMSPEYVVMAGEMVTIGPVVGPLLGPGSDEYCEAVRDFAP